MPVSPTAIIEGRSEDAPGRCCRPHAMRSPFVIWRVLLGRLTVHLSLAGFAIVLSARLAVSDDDMLPGSAGILIAPKAFRAAAAQVQPSLVRIEGFGGTMARPAGGYPAPGEGPTTGLIISPDGLVITSTYNFLKKPPVITVVLADGTRRVAQLLGRDETRKICLLKIADVSDLRVCPIAPREEVKVGQWAVALGVGFGGQQPALSAGIISATNRISGKAIQTDANTSPANYGGPLIDVDGRVIGICVPLTPASHEQAAGAEWYDSGIGFAVPLDGLDEVLARLKLGEALRPAYLGIQLEPPGEARSQPQIKSVAADSPAAKAGLLAADKIIALDKKEVIDAAHLAAAIRRHLAGDTIEITIVRGGERKTFGVELAPPPAALHPPQGDGKMPAPKRRAKSADQ
jgi:serine protease Do